MFNSNSILDQINNLIAIYASIQSTHNTNRRLGAMVAYALPRNFYTETMDWYDEIVKKTNNALKIIRKMNNVSEQDKTKIITECQEFISITKKDKDYRTKRKNLHITLHRETAFSDRGLYSNLVRSLFRDMKPITVSIKGGRWITKGSGDLLYILEFDDSTISNIKQQIEIYTNNYDKCKMFYNEKIEPRRISDADFTHITIAKYSPAFLSKFRNMVNYVLKPIPEQEKFFINKTFTCDNLYLYFLNKTVIYDLKSGKIDVKQGI